MHVSCCCQHVRIRVWRPLCGITASDGFEAHCVFSAELDQRSRVLRPYLVQPSRALASAVVRPSHAPLHLSLYSVVRRDVAAPSPYRAS